MSLAGILSASLNPSSGWYWLRFAFLIPVVLVVFYAIGLGSYAFFAALGPWERPLSPAGFLAAFSVVLAAYALAPDYRMSLATAGLLIGAIFAWILLSPPTRVTSEPGVGGLSYMPIISTYVGGLVAWSICYRRSLRRIGEARCGAA